jgi:hypothetical protein
VPKESFWHLVTHFFYDITHFDSKFFDTLKYLVLRPGFLSKEYLNGRRASYLNPIKMYVFTSAIFFLLFFSFFYSDQESSFTISINGKTLTEIDAMDSAAFASFTANINREDDKAAVPMTREEFRKYKDNVTSTAGIRFGGASYRSKAQYDSMLTSGEKKHNWIQRQFIYKQIAINEKYNHDTRQIIHAFKSTLLHSLPQMLFISLPLLAFILKLIYIRRKQFFYVSHGIFSVHLYIFWFIAMLLLFTFSKLSGYVHWGIFDLIFPLLVLGIFVYQYLALKNFYQQGWIKTFVKFILINSLFIIIIGLLFAVFVLFSLFKI